MPWRNTKKREADMQLEIETILRSWSVLEEEAVKRGDVQEADRLRGCIWRCELKSQMDM